MPVSRDQILDEVTRELIEDMEANKARWEGSMTNEPSEIIQISVGGKAVTSSNLTISGLKDSNTYIPILYGDLKIIRKPPNPNVSGGIKGGGRVLLPPAGFVIDKKATIGTLSSAALNKTLVDFKMVELHTADGKKTEASIYESKECPVLSNVVEHGPFRYFILMFQNMDFKEFKYNAEGVKDGVGAAGKYDAAKATAGT